MVIVAREWFLLFDWLLLLLHFHLYSVERLLLWPKFQLGSFESSCSKEIAVLLWLSLMKVLHCRHCFQKNHNARLYEFEQLKKTIYFPLGKRIQIIFVKFKIHNGAIHCLSNAVYWKQEENKKESVLHRLKPSLKFKERIKTQLNPGYYW